MKNRYWIKLYIGLLHDQRMARLDAVTWRHAVELFLLAGECGDDGGLGSLENIAWQLRVGEEEMESALESLSAMGVVHEEEGEWLVTNFTERQRPSSSTERVRAFRQRKQEAALFKELVPDEVEEGELDPSEECNGIETDETEIKQNETAAAKRSSSASGSAFGSVSDSFSESVSDSGSGAVENVSNPAAVQPAVSWSVPVEDNTCRDDLPKVLTPEAREELDPSLAKHLTKWVEEHPPGWVADAIQEARRYNTASPKYVQAILDRWRVEGREPPKRKVLKKPGVFSRGSYRGIRDGRSGLLPHEMDRHRYLTDGYAEFIEQ